MEDELGEKAVKDIVLAYVQNPNESFFRKFLKITRKKNFKIDLIIGHLNVRSLITD